MRQRRTVGPSVFDANWNNEEYKKEIQELELDENERQEKKLEAP